MPVPPNNPLDRETSTYLDAVRFLCAFAVFTEHIASARLSGSFLWQLRGLGTEAVTIFFVLSGFVIAHVTHERETTLRPYAVNRLARLYSVIVPALAFSFVADRIGFSLRPSLYLEYPQFSKQGPLLQYLSSLFLLHQNWTLNLTPGVNLAYWSLGFEAWYYTIFAAFLFAPLRWRWPTVIAAALLAGPVIVLLMPFWLAGVLAWHICRTRLPSPATGLVLFFGSIALWFAYETWVQRHGRPYIAPSWYLLRIEYVQDWVVTTLFTLNLIGFRAASSLLGRPLLPLRPAIAWCAGATFSLYILHLPAAHLLAAVTPWPVADWRSRLLVAGGTLVACFVFAAFTERRKETWRRWFDAAAARLSIRPA